jgi:hypothetical protein
LAKVGPRAPSEPRRGSTSAGRCVLINALGLSTGRKAWSAITLGSRNLAFLVWLHIPNTTLDADALANLKPEDEETENVRGLIEKRTIINLIQGE